MAWCYEIAASEGVSAIYEKEPMISTMIQPEAFFTAKDLSMSNYLGWYAS